MLNNKSFLFYIFIGLILIDQYIKLLFVNGLTFQTTCINFYLVYNKGIAFSMLTFLGEYLKYIQIVVITGMAIYFIKNKTILAHFPIPAMLIMSGGVSNVIDRFHRIGVVDFVAWNCYFDFAVFNTADIFINLGLLIAIITIIRNKELLNKI